MLFILYLIVFISLFYILSFIFYLLGIIFIYFYITHIYFYILSFYSIVLLYFYFHIATLNHYAFFFELNFEVLRRNIQIQSLVSRSRSTSGHPTSLLASSFCGWFVLASESQARLVCLHTALSQLIPDTGWMTSSIWSLLWRLSRWRHSGHEGGYMMTSLMDTAGVTHIYMHTAPPHKTLAPLDSTTHPGGRGS